MNPFKKIGLIGNGSWATAIIKLLTCHDIKINWHIRKEEDINFFQENHRNPRYLSELEFDLNKINFSSNINEIAEKSEVLYFVVPSAFLDEFTNDLKVDISKKLIVSGIKGIIPSTNLLFADHFNQKYNVPEENIAVIAGPSHAEEIAKGQLSYLTIAASNLYNAETIANQLESHTLRTFINDDVYGIEYAAVLKNIYALAAGICQGLGYGDNFNAVLVSNAITEIERFVNTVAPRERSILSSAYLGDLLATGYSKHSRNRTFGMMIGKGYSVKAAKLEMNMIAEGYYATESFYKINAQYNIFMPILEAVYNILYENKPAGFEIKLLTHKIR
ncbi:MAG: NAD(P)H-dependent glycerol-3-phosphate dehydrogenase [Bacteroidales bacterium]|nr:NAD(P)H-dependent glycerol-3-phosphate dehydrogenase [Bacteroidales bacterium]